MVNKAHTCPEETTDDPEITFYWEPTEDAIYDKLEEIIENQETIIRLLEIPIKE